MGFFLIMLCIGIAVTLFVKSSNATKQGERDYDAKVKAALESTTPEEQQQLQELYDSGGTNVDLYHLEDKALVFYWNKLKTLANSEYNRPEAEKLSAFDDYFGFLQDVQNTLIPGRSSEDFTRLSFNKLEWRLDNNMGPEPLTLDVDPMEFGLNFRKSETPIFVCQAGLFKTETIRSSTFNYGGLAGSIKIGGGLKYRYGSMRVHNPSYQQTVLDEQGMFWITDKRIGFNGEDKMIQFTHKQIANVRGAGDSHMFLWKNGKQKPYDLLLTMPDEAALLIQHYMSEC